MVRTADEVLMRFRVTWQPRFSGNPGFLRSAFHPRTGEAA